MSSELGGVRGSVTTNSSSKFSEIANNDGFEDNNDMADISCGGVDGGVIPESILKISF
jgi:hypothetical protein